jgi:hypothetical protein
MVTATHAGRVVGAALTLALVLLPLVARAGDDEGFKPLFNGKDLSGWVTPDDKDLFSVEDGEIVGRTRAGQLKKNEFLVTDRSYGDFTLKLKVKILGGNSGVQFRSAREPNGRVTGPQADIAESYWGSLYYEGFGMLIRYPQEYARDLVRKGDWNEITLTVKGNHAVGTLNGRTVFDVVDPKFARDGVIALQVHMGPAMEVRFKDLVIKADD